MQPILCTFSPLTAATARSTTLRRELVFRVSAQKGFGSQQSAQPRVQKRRNKGGRPLKTEFIEDEEEARLSEQEKALRRARDILGAKTAAPTPVFQEQSADDLSPAVPEDFEARLALLRKEGAARAAASGATGAQDGSAPTAPLLPFEAAPPAVPATAAPESEEDRTGPPGWVRALAVGAIAVFLVVYGASSDLVMGTSTSTRSASSLTSEERKKVETLAETFQKAGSAATAQDALNSAKALATLGRFDESAAAYKAAYENAEGGADVAVVALPGEIDSLTRAGKPEAAATAADAFVASRGADVAAGGIPDLDTVDLELLRAKARVSWPGHEDEALGIYDGLVAANRDDFRPLLGKGLALAATGKPAEAERALIEARFLAPKDARPLVDKAIRASQQQ